MNLMNKYYVSYDELIILYISDLRQWMKGLLAESRSPSVIKLVNEHVKKIIGDLNNRKMNKYRLSKKLCTSKESIK